MPTATGTSRHDDARHRISLRPTGENAASRPNYLNFRTQRGARLIADHDGLLRPSPEPLSS
jgi:hypothetical protein